MRWKSIEGYRYPYRINEDGDVQRLQENGEWLNLHPFLMKGGGGSAGCYMFVNMAVLPAGHKKVAVVRLMEGRFIRHRRPGEVISYRNGMTQDCSAWNLYHTTHGEMNKKLRNCRKPVEKIGRDGTVIDIYRSVSEAARRNFISTSCVYKRCMGRIKDPFGLTGYSFRYEHRAGRRFKCETKEGQE